MKICAVAGDNGSGDLFQSMLKDEEGHADFLDAQLRSIKEMGIANYLSQQLHGKIGLSGGFGKTTESSG